MVVAGESGRGWSRRRRWVVGIAGALALVLLLGAVLVVRWVTFSPDPSGKDVALSETSTVQTFALAGKTVSLSVPDSAGTAFRWRGGEPNVPIPKCDYLNESR